MKHSGNITDTLGILTRVLRRFGPKLQPYRWLLLGGLIALVAEIALRLLEPWALKIVFDVLLRPASGKLAWAAQWVRTVGPDSALLFISAFVIAVAGLRAFSAYANTIRFAQVGSRVLSQVRSDLFRHLQCLSLSFHHRSRNGDLVLRVINDVSVLQDALVTALIPMTTKTVMLIGMVVLMFMMNARLALVSVALLPLFWLRGVTLSRRIHETARRQRHREGDMAATAAESFGAVQVVQALSLQDRFAASFTQRNQSALREDVRGKRLSAKLERSVDVFIAAATALVLWQGTQLVWRQEITAGDLLVFLAYLKTAFRPLQDTAKYSSRLARAAAAGERVLSVMEEGSGVSDGPNAKVAPSFRGELRFENVTFRYPAQGEQVGRGVERISFEVKPGQWVALVGPSGSGKSTLMALVSRLHDPVCGCVSIDGQDVRSFTVQSLRAQISVVLQDTGLFAASVADNIRASREDAGDADIEAAARLANAHEFITQLPDGYQTVLGERGVTLSQGQRQRIAIARAALRKAPILLLDEPTNGLDESNAQSVFAGLRRLAPGCTTLMATHDLDQAAQADVILVLEDGRIVQRLTGRELRVWQSPLVQRACPDKSKPNGELPCYRPLTRT